VNYTFITAGGEIDFARFAAPVLRALDSLGVDATLGGRNDLVSADGAKISGNAACVRRTPFGERRMHHGTLLFDADVGEMARALTPSAEKLASKGVKSVRSRVANIRSLSSALANADAVSFADKIAVFAAAEFGSNVEDLTKAQKEGISALADAKYRKWEWNWGESPSFSVTKSRRYPFGTVDVGFTASHGTLDAVGVTGDFFSVEDVNVLCERLVGSRLERDALMPLLLDVGRFIEGALPEDIVSLICE
jgi:lipoate-protein ligase A